MLPDAVVFFYWLCRSASKGWEQDLYTVYEEFVDKDQ